MSFLFSYRMNFDKAATEVPTVIVEEAHLASQKIRDPEAAKEIFDQLLPILEVCRPNRTFALACGMLMEKQRHAEGMLEFWSDLLTIFPDDLTSLRMMMRWYRRERLNVEGIEKVHSFFPDCHGDVGQAEKAIVALSELKAFQDIDEMMASIFAADLDSRALQMRYVKVLCQQSRFLDAHEIIQSIHDQHKMGMSSQELISKVTRRAASLRKLYTEDASDAFAAILDQIPTAKKINSATIGTISFFTGQLGTGGAERQLTRIASAFQNLFERAEKISDTAVVRPPTVCVRHASPESGGDFFLPMLRRARVRTNILTEMREITICDLNEISADLATFLDILPEDICAQTCKLIPYFQKQRTDVAYLWQDGGVLSAALAALIAGVPRVVTSFRGLPPNLRPNLMRPEFEPLYRALALRPEVTFTANSRSSALAYERWLGLQDGTVKTIPNAIPEVLPYGDQTDHEYWDELETLSKGCDQTVLGVFRFDANKRPLEWIDAAAEYIQSHPNTRFVIVGSGYLFGKAKEHVRFLGMQNRIFLAGVRRNVGFFLHRSELVMHLARLEGLPNVLIEAHLAGKPVLATPAGGTDEVVINGETGLILSSAEDPPMDEILTYLERLLKDPERLSAMGASALAHAKPTYLVDQVVEKTLKTFATTKVLQ